MHARGSARLPGPMLERSSLLAFLVGVLFLCLGAFTLLVAYPRTTASLESREDRQHRESLKSWGERERDEVRDDDSSEASPHSVLIMGAVMLLTGLGLTLPQTLKWLGETAFKEAVLEPPQEGASLGGEALVRVRLVPGGALRVASAELRLISEEQAQYYEESELGAFNQHDEERRRTRVMEVHRWSTRLAVPQELSAPFELEVPVPIHRELPPTFRWERHLTVTRLELEVELIGRVNLHLEKPLRILPRLASGEADA